MRGAQEGHPRAPWHFLRKARMARRGWSPRALSICPKFSCRRPTRVGPWGTWASSVGEIPRHLNHKLCIGEGSPWAGARCQPGDPGWGLAKWACPPSLGGRCVRFSWSLQRSWNSKGWNLVWRRACLECAQFSRRCCSPFWRCSQRMGHPQGVERFASAIPLGPMGDPGWTQFRRPSGEGASCLEPSNPWPLWGSSQVFPGKGLWPGGSLPWRWWEPSESWLGCDHWARFSWILSRWLDLVWIWAQSKPSRMGCPS